MQQSVESFRNTIGTINEKGKRAWIYAKKPKGKFYTYREYVSYILLFFFLSAPFIKVGGNQFLLFNVIERKFNIFGFPFWPQDFYLLVVSMIIGVVFVTLFTVAFGRIFCGWICPQTIFLEMVFRRIEFWIEGDRGAQIRLDKQNWNTEKIIKKGFKWFVFFIISFIIANIFLAYIIGSDTLLELIKDKLSNNGNTLVALFIFTAVFYFVFAWFREQVCIIVCPYGRLQGVLLDTESIIVAYDHVRGEKQSGRARFSKKEDRAAVGKGDCIDCFQCVNVCPTGIDIRNGTQLECVNCTACIDACNHMMEKVGLPKGLIRYASEDEITKKESFRFTVKLKGYIAVLTVLCGLLIGMLFLRANVETTILRLPGQLFEHKGAYISNVFTYKMINKTTKNLDSVHFKLLYPEGEIKQVGDQIFKVKRENMTQGTLFIEVRQSVLKGDKTKLKIGIFNGNELLETTTTNFLGPRNFN